MNALIKFAQRRDVFICDFVATIEIYQVYLYMMYSNPSNNYQHDHFQVFSDVVENSSTISTKNWVIDLNNGMETLVFGMVSHSYATHIFNMLIGIKQHVYKAIFETSIMQMKGRCFVVADMFITELDWHFVDSKLMNALGIVYP